MVDKKTEDKKEKDPFSDSSEIFESIFKEATQEIQKETGKPVSQPVLKPKPKPEVKPKPEAKPKAPIKLELEAKEEPKPRAEPPQEKPRPEQKPRIHAPVFKPRQEPIRKPITRAPKPDEEEKGEPLLSTHRLERSRIRAQEPKEEPRGKDNKPKLPGKKGKGSPIIKIILLLLLLAVGVGGASVYFGILDLSEYIGWPAPKEAPKVAATKPSPAQQPAKPPQPAAPKPAQPSAPPAKPTEAQKPAVQPPQPPPKPAERVTPPQPATASPVAPPQPPAVQAKPETPAPPAVAKVETPPPPVQPATKVEPPTPQPQAKVEPPPAPVQPPAVSQPQAPPAPVKPPVKIEPKAPAVQPAAKTEPKAPPAPVQQPPAPKKVETPQSSSQPKEIAAAKAVPPVIGSGVGYPFSVYLGSVQGMDYVKKAIMDYQSQGLSAYWSKVDLGAKGTWYRLFTGYFRSAQEADAFIQQKKIKDGEVKETKYTNLIGTFGNKQGAEEKALALVKMGLSAYEIPAAGGQVRVYSGAFITREGAEKNQAELNSKGIKSGIVER